MGRCLGGEGLAAPGFERGQALHLSSHPARRWRSVQFLPGRHPPDLALGRNGDCRREPLRLAGPAVLAGKSPGQDQSQAPSAPGHRPAFPWCVPRPRGKSSVCFWRLRPCALLWGLQGGASVLWAPLMTTPAASSLGSLFFPVLLNLTLRQNCGVSTTTVDIL